MHNWIINLIYTVLLTSVTGSIFSILWYFIGLALQKAGFIDLQYALLKVVVVLWMVPIAFLLLKGTNHIYMIFGGDLFALSPVIYKFSVCFCAVWLTGTVICLAVYIVHLVQLKHRYRNAIVCDDELYQELCRVCDELSVKRNRIELVWDYKQQVPAIKGAFHATIVLPTSNYTKQELRTIFLHEVMHYKQQDILLKNVFAIIEAVHWFNPIVWWIGSKLPQLSECVCDYSVIPHAGGIRNYYEVILGMAEPEQLPLSYTAQLMESETNLVKRVEKMHMVFRKKNRSKWFAGGLLILFFLTGTTMAYAASYAAGASYLAWFDATVVEIEEKYHPVAYQEYHTEDIQSELSGAKTLELNEDYPTAAIEGISVPGECYIVEPVYMEKGRIVWSAFPEGQANIQMGIIHPDGSSTYVVAQEEGGNVFHIEEAGEYGAYIKNIGSEDAAFTASVMIISEEE